MSDDDTVDVDAPVDPFGASVPGVEKLLPRARLIATADLKHGQEAVSREDARGFVEDLTGRVAVRVAHRDRLSEARQADLVRAARDVIHNGAASYVEAARFPEQSDRTESSYAGLLWSRYLEGVKDLVATLDGWLDDADSTSDGGAGGAAASFPPTTIHDLIRF